MYALSITYSADSSHFPAALAGRLVVGGRCMEQVPRRLGQLHHYLDRNLDYTFGRDIPARLLMALRARMSEGVQGHDSPT